VSVTGLGHLDIETHQWEASVSFWSALGFSFSTEWETEGHRGGRLESGSAAMVLAEVPEEQTPAFSPFFTLEDATDYVVGEGASVITPLEDTRWIRVRDAEGSSP